MRRATGGREVTASARAGAALLLDDPDEEDPRRIARAHLMAFGLLDLRTCAQVALAFTK